MRRTGVGVSAVRSRLGDGFLRLGRRFGGLGSVVVGGMCHRSYLCSVIEGVILTLKKSRVSCTLLTVLMMFSGCSLLKVSVSSGEPLPEEDVQLRMFTRSFYNIYRDGVAETADSIFTLSGNPSVKMRAIRWKIQSTGDAAGAALRSVPELSAIEMWLLCERQCDRLSQLPDSSLFGEYSFMARRTAERLASRYASQLSRQLPEVRFSQMKGFVELRLAALSSGEKADTTHVFSAWQEYLKQQGVEHRYPAGSIPEAITDVGDKLEGYASRLSDNVSWETDLWRYRLEEDSVYARFNARMDSLNRDFSRIVTVAEHMPEISNYMLEDLNSHVEEMIVVFNDMVNNTFAGFDQQRRELQQYITRERSALMADVRRVATESVATALDALPGMVGKIVGWVILLLIVLLGVPFAMGFWLGRLSRKRKRHPNDNRPAGKE